MDAPLEVAFLPPAAAALPNAPLFSYFLLRDKVARRLEWLVLLLIETKRAVEISNEMGESRRELGFKPIEMQTRDYSVMTVTTCTGQREQAKRWKYKNTTERQHSVYII